MNRVSPYSQSSRHSPWAGHLDWFSIFLWGTSLSAAALVLLPVAYLLVRMLGAGPQTWEIVTRTSTQVILLRTLGLALAVAAACALIAVPLAWLTVRTDLPLRRLWTVTGSLPLVIPSYVGAYLLVASLGPRGLIAQVLEGWLGLERIPSIYGFPGSFYLLTILSFPYTFLSVRTALLRMDPALEEAAQSLGLNRWRVFWTTVLPQLRPGLIAGSLLVSLYVLRDFGAVSLLRYDTFTRVIYMQYRSAFDRSSAAGLALVLLSVSLTVLIISQWNRHPTRSNRSEGGRRPRAIISLGAWRLPALIFTGGLALASLVIPLGVLVYWLVRGWHTLNQVSPLWNAASNSLLGSSLAALATLIVALPIALLVVRRPSRWSHWLERLTYTGFALPGIVVALALVFFGTNYALPLYQSLMMLVFAYIILFLPQMVGAVRTSLLQVSPSYEEAARSLGNQPWQVFRRVTLPLVLPGIQAGMAMVFLTTMKELPATLILGPIGFKTLAVSVWTSVSEAYFAQAAVPALLLILVSSIPAALFTLKEEL